MPQVFPPSIPADEDLDVEASLLAAVDIAIRDLRDIETRCLTIDARSQAAACRLMLERAFVAALGEPVSA